MNVLICVTKGNYCGGWSIPIDPTVEFGGAAAKDVGEIEVIVPLVDVAAAKAMTLTETEPAQILAATFPCYEYTKVLSVGTWTNISMTYNFPVGSKTRVQTKWRVFPQSTWYDSGSVDISVDSSVSNGTQKTGQYKYDLTMEFKYDHMVTGSGQGIIEYVFGVNTASDPRSSAEVPRYSWGGTLPTNDNYYYIDQGANRAVSITGSNANYVFSVGISVYAGLSLGVVREPSPATYATVTVYGGTWTTNYDAKMVFYVGDNPQQSAINWVYHP